MTEHWAVIPVKGFNESKTRLTSILGPKRKLFVAALLQDVLSSVSRSEVFDKILLVSPDGNLARVANSRNVEFLQQGNFGLNRGIEQANKFTMRRGANSSTIVLGDIPLAEPRDYREILEMGTDRRRIVMAPSLKGGTNVMMSNPPDLVRPSYGRWSYSKHLRQAQLNAISTYSVSNPRLSFDIDTFDDLLELRRRDPRMKMSSARVLAGVDLSPPAIHAQP